MSDLVFGITWQRKSEPIGQRVVALARWLGGALGCKVTPKVSLSYEELIEAARKRAVDVAWLPPIVRLMLEREGHVKSLLVNERAQTAIFHSVVACATESRLTKLEDLAGARAAWVDPYSAAGYVMPRLYMHERGLDVARAFESEQFFGSHDAAIARVLAGLADVTATYANLDASGRIVSAGWKTIPEGAERMRVLTAVGVIPADVIAVRSDLAGSVCVSVSLKLIGGMNEPESRRIIQDALDIEAFRAPREDDERVLARSLERARAAGLFRHVWEDT